MLLDFPPDTTLWFKAEAPGKDTLFWEIIAEVTNRQTKNQANNKKLIKKK